MKSLALLLALLLAWPAQAMHTGPEPTEPAPRPELREELFRLPMQVPDAQGRMVSGHIRVTLFRPPGDGPFPLALILHGRDARHRGAMPRPRFESATRYFLRKGFAVAVPQRLGYGPSAEAGDPEASLSCQQPRYAEALAATALQVRRVLGALAQHPGVDAKRVVLAGVSVGGAGALAATALGLPGHVATLNFSGGHGGNPQERPGLPCAPERLAEVLARYGELSARHGATPTLWLYAENDQYFSPDVARRWHAAYQTGGGRAELLLLPALAEDGHHLFNQGNDQWQPLADAFLAGLGFHQPGAQPRPAAAPGRKLQSVADLPLGGRQIEAGYRRFLELPLPRAFVIDPVNRRWAMAHGDDAITRALAHCEQDPRARCRPYALDDQVVWGPPPAPDSQATTP